MSVCGGRRASVTLALVGFALVAIGCTPNVIGLRPAYPKVSGEDGARYVKVKSLRPVMRWEAFPTKRDREQDATGWLRRVRDVTYDLKIHRADADYPAGIVYRRQALPAPSHALEEPLAPGSKYFWTIRARFRLDGETRVTEWSSLEPLERVLRDPARRLPRVPSPFYFRFATPSQ